VRPLSGEVRGGNVSWLDDCRRVVVEAVLPQGLEVNVALLVEKRQAKAAQERLIYFRLCGNVSLLREYVLLGLLACPAFELELSAVRFAVSVWTPLESVQIIR
jgi:hypothetical protein